MKGRMDGKEAALGSAATRAATPRRGGICARPAAVSSTSRKNAKYRASDRMDNGMWWVSVALEAKARWDKSKTGLEGSSCPEQTERSHRNTVPRTWTSLILVHAQCGDRQGNCCARVAVGTVPPTVVRIASRSLFVPT